MLFPDNLINNCAQRPESIGNNRINQVVHFQLPYVHNFNFIEDLLYKLHLLPAVGIDREQPVALFYALAEERMQVNPCSLVIRRSGNLGNP